MKVSEAQSAHYIDSLAQGVPFRFIDRVVCLDETFVETELHDVGLPYRFADAGQVDSYAILEFAAQSSGLILRGRKKPGQRGVITSFRDVKRRSTGSLAFPLRLTSKLIHDRSVVFEFRFQVRSGGDLAVEGSINLFIGG